jgi:hypothetical protein
MFIESFGNATLHNGILRIECKILGGDGKENTSGHLVFPAQQAGVIAQQLEQILSGIKKMIDEANAKKAN